MITQNPTHITWTGDKSENVDGFAANVTVYTKNNRKDTHTSQTNSYRMSLKKIDNVLHTRLDFDRDANGVYRSAVSNADEIAVFDTYSGQVAFRISSRDTVHPDLLAFNAENMISRINLSKIRNEAARLAFDTLEDSPQTLTFALPSHYFTNDREQRISTRVSFDAVNEVLEEVQIVNALEDGTLITTTTNPLYQDHNGTPIKIGTASTIESKAPGLIDGFSDDVKIYESDDDFETISPAELRELQAKGVITPIEDLVFGNPADLSYIETIIEVYSDIEINTVSDETFRIMGR